MGVVDWVREEDVVVYLETDFEGNGEEIEAILRASVVLFLDD